MKKILIIVLFIGVVAGSYSCQEYFLERPDTTGTVDLEKVFSNTKNAEAALFSCYRNALIAGLPGGVNFSYQGLGIMSGELSRGYDWEGGYALNNTGLTSNATIDNFQNNWSSIRASYIVKENIDKVVDMEPEMKEYIKGEATALVAYRYMMMFYRYGGMPIVRGSLLSDDDLNIPRASLQEMLDFIVELCDEAYALLPNSWESLGAGGTYVGRATKGVALAIKARALTYAARPLFNSATPYIDNGEYNNLICFGSADQSRWQDAIDANEAVLNWAQSNGKGLIYTAGAGNRNTKTDAARDYGRACSEFNNKEVLLAYKNHDSQTYIISFYNTSDYQWWDSWYRDRIGMLTNFLENYYDDQGGDISWPHPDDPAPRDKSDWAANINKIEARFRVDLCVTGLGGWSNDGDSNWSQTNRDKPLANYTENPNTFPGSNDLGKGAGFNTKFYYGAGSRMYTEIPLFRLAETYLNLAEAYNEIGNATNALKNLNMIHERAGLPEITQTDKAKLRQLIWREKAIEYFNENHRYFDVKHWKHPDIGTNIIGGPKRELHFLRRDGNSQELNSLTSYWDLYAFESYWHDRLYLEPVPQSEVNKGVISQNPGY
jgi:hypothetical protein